MTPIGLDIGFAAQVRTYVDGQLALETKLAWTDQGPQIQRSGDLAATTAQGLGAGWSAVLPGAEGGQTQILQDLSQGRIASVIVNSASNRDIRQQTDITLTLPQLAQLQQQVAAARFAANLQAAMALAQGGPGAGH